MRETEYAYAIARIRANELKMLGAQDLERLISAESYDAAVRILTDKGWAQPDANSAYDICEAELESAWQFISESVPDRSL
ncbi:MAG: V-type ATPase subunit, partial [Clostridia bacterium]|nr:V-type ATPase subunit [Clostridia bacterium]